MKVVLIVTVLALGWFALFVLGLFSYVVGHSSMVNPLPLLPCVGLVWLIVTATVIIIVVVRAVHRSDDEDATRRAEEIRRRRTGRPTP